MHGQRFLGDARRMLVHDLDREDPEGCDIDAITAAEDDRPFEALQEARSQGYGACHRCIDPADASGSIRGTPQ